MNKVYTTILFDLDGTLTDPKIGITKSMQFALNKLGIEENNLKSLEQFIGPPLIDTFKNFYHFNEEKALLAVEYFREYFADTGLYENILYGGIDILLKKLVVKNKILFIVTSKPAVYAKKTADYFHIKAYFNDIIGPDLDLKNAAKDILIKEVLDKYKYKINQQDVIMIGDRSHDIIGANKNNLDSAGVLYGYGTKEELTYAGATYIIETVNNLEKFLLNLQ